MSTMAKKANRKLGFLRLAMVASTSAIIIAIGMALVYLNLPTVGHPCSVRNATAPDAAGRTMRCTPTMAEGNDAVWQYVPAA